MICFCASTRYAKEIKKVSNRLDELGIKHFNIKVEVPKEKETPDMIKGYIREHFKKIDKSSAILVINPQRYFGNSVKIEIGYAKGKGKKIYYLRKTNQVELDYLADKIIPFNKLETLKNES